MLKMLDIEIIRKLYHVHGKSIREISCQLRHSRKTIRKVLGEHFIPQYKRRKPYPCPVLGSFHAIIEQWLESDKKVYRKQRHTITRIFQRLREEYNYQGSYVTVRNYMAGRNPKEVFIPLTFGPGKNAQCDWGKAKVYLKGKLEDIHLFYIKLSHSKVPFMMVFPTERQEAFFEGHRQAFEFYGGVPREITYDNLTTAVKKILKGKNRQEQDKFTHFRAHYLFDSNFCNRGKGNEKGGVENFVGYGRRNFLVPIPHCDSYEDLNAHLREKCLAELKRKHPEHKDRTIGEFFAEEQKELIALPKYGFECCRITSAIVDRCAIVDFETNKYSVPCQYVGEVVEIKAFVDRIHVVFKGKVIAEHKRSYKRKDEIFDPYHYLPALQRKPAALRDGKPFKNWHLPEIFEQYFGKLKAKPKGPNEFVKILGLLLKYSEAEVAKALKESYELGAYGYEVILNLVRRGREKKCEIEEFDQQESTKWPNCEGMDFKITHFDELIFTAEQPKEELELCHI